MGEKQRQSILILLSLLFVLLAVYYFFYYQPSVEEKQQVEIQLAQVTAKAQQAAGKEKIEEGKPPQEKVQKIAEQIPVEPYTEQLVLDLGKLQSIGRVELVNVTFESGKDVSAKELAAIFAPAGKEKDGDNTKVAASLQQALQGQTIKSVEMNLSIKGAYKDIYTFVSELQNVSRYLRVDELSFTSPRKDDFVIPKKNVLDASLKLTSYYAPQYAPLLDKKLEPVVPQAAGKKDPTQ